MASFYKQQRIEKNILMLDDNPIGGKWSFDEENRKKIPESLTTPSQPKFKEDISNRGYDATPSLILLTGALVFGLISYLVTHHYCLKLEDFQVNYWQNILVYLSFVGFLGTLLILDPPGESGVRPSAWGGFVLNLIFAFGSLFIGFGIGVALAFGRRSSLPIFSFPSIGIIELVRAND
mgnify:CR=1 FL=1